MKKEFRRLLWLSLNKKVGSDVVFFVGSFIEFFCCLKASSILVQLEKYHTSTQNQITNIFARFLDNLPKDVLSLPIDECEEQYLRMYVKKVDY